MHNPVTTAHLFALAFLMLAALAACVSVGVVFAGVVREKPLEHAPGVFFDAIGAALFGLVAVGFALVLA